MNLLQRSLNDLETQVAELKKSKQTAIKGLLDRAGSNTGFPN